MTSIMQPNTCGSGDAGEFVNLPDPILDAGPTPSPQTAVLAGGCFWGAQAVFQHVRGVIFATCGYAGGDEDTANYERVCDGDTGHAEAVEIRYDASVIRFGELLKIFFAVAHDPTQKNRQGPDFGAQYRSEIFTQGPEQDEVARAYIRQLDAAGVFSEKIATRVSPLQAFYPAERYHQDYALQHPHQPYIAFHDLPKVARLKAQFPGHYRPDAALTPP